MYGIILILFFEWFYNHPALRYGGYNLIAIIIFLPISVYLSSKNIKFNNYKFTSSVLIILTVIIFFLEEICTGFTKSMSYTVTILL